MVGFGRYGLGGDYYLFQSGQEERVDSTSEDVRTGADGGQASAISADPYGLISRWKIQQENESRQTL